MADITVHFKHIFSPIDPFYHDYLVYTNDLGNQYYIRGGPSLNKNSSIDWSTLTIAGGNGGPLPWGYIYTQQGTYDPSSPDYPPSGWPDDTQTLISGSQASLDIYWQALQLDASNINGQKILYGGAAPNSNSFLSAILGDVGLPLPTGTSLDGPHPSPGANSPLTAAASNDLLPTFESYLSSVIHQEESTLSTAFQNALTGIIGAFSAASSYANGQAASDGVSKILNADGTTTYSISGSPIEGIEGANYTLDLANSLLTYGYVLIGGGNSLFTFDPAQANLSASHTENADGSSDFATYGSDGSSVTTSYSGPDAAGLITKVDRENADGTSEITIYNADGSSVTTVYNGLNGSGTVTSQTYNLPAGITEIIPSSSVPTTINAGAGSTIDISSFTGTIAGSGVVNLNFQGYWHFTSPLFFGLPPNTVVLAHATTGGLEDPIALPGIGVASEIAPPFPTLEAHSAWIYNWQGPDGSVNDGTTQVELNFGTPLCFVAGTHIRTACGEVPVEQLSAGDKVVTWDGRVRPIIWVGVGRVLATRGQRSAATPVIVRKNALADNVPSRDLRITKAHSLYLDGFLIPVEFLVNHRSILWDDRAQEVAIYHIELEGHDVLVAEGAPAESYRDDGNRWLFQNANAAWSSPPQGPCAPVVTGGPVVDAVWRRLLDRAGSRPGLPLTDDPDLHILADGYRFDAPRQSGGVYVFRLPKIPSSLRIVSRSAVPAELGVARDPRQLGVALKRIVVRRGTQFLIIEAEDDRLEEGFHAYEPTEGFRWTDGEAVIPAAIIDAFEGPQELVLHVAMTTRYLDDGQMQRAVA